MFGCKLTSVIYRNLQVRNFLLDHKASFPQSKFSLQLISTRSTRIMSEIVEGETLNATPECKLPESEQVSKGLDDDQETLIQLRESYAEANKDSSNLWLNHSKSCYIYLYRGGGEPSSSLASFDLDQTLIKPKGKKKIPKTATDWEFFSVWTKVKLQQAIRDNSSRFVIFTNQNGVGLGLVDLKIIQERIELVTKRLNMPCTVFVATEKDQFRKPQISMFNLFEKSFNDGLKVDRESSFYCGDAIGYPTHSDADIKFAQALKLPFLTPEKFLRGVKPKLATT